jgi:predicted DsbA family dithiol-disulfide isomerase
LWKGVPIRWRSHSSLPGSTLGAVEQAKIASVIVETGIRVVLPQRWIDSHNALIGSELAREAGVFDSFHDSIFRSAFEQGVDISDHKRLTEIAAQTGMDAEAFSRGIRERLTEPQLLANKAEADEFSALGYPTFLLGEFPLIGIQPKATMRLLIERFLSQRRAMPQL